MLERTEWATRWGFGWEMYAPMLRLCRERGIPVIALNAEKEITRTVSREGLDALTPEQRASLPPLDATDAGAPRVREATRSARTARRCPRSASSASTSRW